MAHFTPLEWLAVVEHELLLFAGVFFLLGAFDEFAIDLAWIWLRLKGRIRSSAAICARPSNQPLKGRAAVFIPAWREDAVIEHTIAHALAAWPHGQLRLYVGCYRNDPDTCAAIVRGANDDSRVRIVIHDRDGPTTKADCLNRLYAELEADERKESQDFRLILLQDAEDMVDSAALGLLDEHIEHAEFVQLPVLPEPQAQSRWIGSHYCEEFAEAHGKALVVRETLGAALPAAGVGCCFARPILQQLARQGGADGPFSVTSLTEDYELGLRIKAAGGSAKFLRARGEDGRLIATRACFPARIDHSVRQKARWVHGIAFQGWDRLGWEGGVTERWMRLRDRRGPLTALVLFVGYVLVILGAILLTLVRLGLVRPLRPEPLLVAILWVNLASFGWRALMRAAFTTREYGVLEGARAVLRIPVTNIIAMMAARRALVAYLRTLRGQPVGWDKTPHTALPAQLLVGRIV